MKNPSALFLLTTMLFFASCSKENNQNTDPAGTAVQDPAILLGSFANWWDYNSKQIKLYEDFTAFDTGSKEISTKDFMKSVASGDFIPVKYIGMDSSSHYKLYKIPADADPSIKPALKGWMALEYANYLLKGKALPKFNFIDLNGNVYDQKTTKGKIVVLKCWFIGCKPCVAEMSELNKLVSRYKDRKDIVFVSLAFDSAEKLRDFLKKKNFDYAVVADQQDYVTNTLGIKAAPTHLIINKAGVITKVVNRAEILMPLVDQLVMQTSL